MIDELKIYSFKSFSEQTVKLNNLTVLTGLNNAGKSTIIQSLRMCLTDNDSESPHLDSLGGYAEMKSSLTNPLEPIKIQAIGNGIILRSLQVTSKGHTYEGDIKLPVAEFISADRLGPRVRLPLIPEDNKRISVGTHGEHSAHYASIFANTHTHEIMRHSGSQSKTVAHQLTHWMGEISPGIKLDFEVAKKYDSSRVAINEIRPTNCGFGISYTLPIILSLLTTTGLIGEDDSDTSISEWFSTIKSRGALVIIENPEAHLHPRGQTELGKFIALAAFTGVQVVIETHSDHLIDGIRLAVKNMPEFSHLTSILYVSKEDDRQTECEIIQVKPDGKLDKWPSGFFDQQSINLRNLSSRN